MPTPLDLAALPKAEQGSVRPATLEELAAREGVGISRSYHDLNSFVEVYMAATRIMTRPGDYKRLVREYAEDARAAGGRYAELEVSPALGTRTLDCLEEAAEAAARQTDVELRLILGLGRVMPDDVKRMAVDAAKHIPGLVAIGLGGPEDGNPAAPFADVFAEARRLGLRSAPHAGENAGPASVRDTVEALNPDRIQHGVRSVEDAALVVELAERRMPLAVCPTSNLRLGIVKSFDEHPLRDLWDAGVIVSVNTDDPGIFDCDLVGEYAVAGHLLDLDRAGYGRLALNSVEGSFAPEELKAELRTEIEDWVRRKP